MRSIVTLAFILCVIGQPSALAADAPGAITAASVTGMSRKSMLRNAIGREAARLALTLSKTAIQTTRPSAAAESSWIRRHPILFGALVGAGAGAVSSIPRWTELYCAGGGDEDCLFHGGTGVLFGTGAGAGVGALIGVLLRR